MWSDVVTKLCCWARIIFSHIRPKLEPVRRPRYTHSTDTHALACFHARTHAHRPPAQDPKPVIAKSVTPDERSFGLFWKTHFIFWRHAPPVNSARCGCCCPCSFFSGLQQKKRLLSLSYFCSPRATFSSLLLDRFGPFIRSKTFDKKTICNKCRCSSFRKLVDSKVLLAAKHSSLTSGSKILAFHFVEETAFLVCARLVEGVGCVFLATATQGRKSGP